jgi:hypothetical protein
MQCHICKKKSILKRNIFNLFETNINLICETCYVKYPLLTSFKIIPIEDYQVSHYLLISRLYHLDPLAYMNFLKPYYLNYLKNHQNQIVLYFDVVELSTYDLLDSLKLGDIYLVSLYENIDEKGEIL